MSIYVLGQPEEPTSAEDLSFSPTVKTTEVQTDQPLLGVEGEGRVCPQRGSIRKFGQ